MAKQPVFPVAQNPYQPGQTKVEDYVPPTPAPEPTLSEQTKAEMAYGAKMAQINAEKLRVAEAARAAEKVNGQETPTDLEAEAKAAVAEAEAKAKGA